MTKGLSERFPHTVRIVRSAEYKALYNTGKKIHSGNFVLFIRENTLGHARLGITVSRKIGRATVRNRTKRLFREIFRKSTAEIPNNLDIVVNAKPGCPGAGYIKLQKEFIDAVKKIALKGTSSKGKE